MSVQKEKNNNSLDSYIHVCNYSIEGKKLFVDDDDYQSFFIFLKEYLCRTEFNNNKKTFSVRGKTFKGIPHQPKNYHNKVELIAYDLEPNHFHLVVREIVKGSIEKLIRSLSTRYVIYYNKKYQRRGSLFAGPYKSVQIKSNKEILLLTLFLHRESLNNHNGEFSSYKYYLEQKISQYLKKDIVLSYYKNPKNIYLKASSNYESFVENYKLDKDDLETLKRVVIEDISKTSQKHVTNLSYIKDSKISDEYDQKFIQKQKNTKSAAFFATSFALFFILLGFGIRNIESTKANFQNLANKPSPPSPAVSGLQTTGSELTETDSGSNPEEEEINKIIVRVQDASAIINIREKPTIESNVIGTAKDGDIFEFKSSYSDWYEISYKGTSAFISKMFAEKLKED